MSLEVIDLEVGCFAFDGAELQNRFGQSAARVDGDDTVRILGISALTV
jgi:hypothetical protein